MFGTLSTMTHDMLLLILPFGSGYLCDEHGMPCEKSLKVTLMFQSLALLSDPMVTKTVEIN